MLLCVLEDMSHFRSFLFFTEKELNTCSFLHRSLKILQGYGNVLLYFFKEILDHFLI